MRKYEGVETSAATFDVNIGRYTEVANQVSLQESVTSVYFIVVYSNLLKNSILAHIDDWQKRHTDLLKKRAYDKITSRICFDCFGRFKIKFMKFQSYTTTPKRIPKESTRNRLIC